MMQFASFSLARQSCPSRPAVQLRDASYLLRLPVELHLEIVKYISPPHDGSFLSLRLANRYFYRIIPAPDHETVLRIEKTAWAKQRSLYTCRHCPERDGSIGLRHRLEFRDDMINENSGGDHWKALSPSKRFCAECGFHLLKRSWWVGKFIFVGGVAWIQCFHCGKVRKGVDVSERKKCMSYCGDCNGCWGSDSGRDEPSPVVSEGAESEWGDITDWEAMADCEYADDFVPVDREDHLLSLYKNAAVITEWASQVGRLPKNMRCALR